MQGGGVTGFGVVEMATEKWGRDGVYRCVLGGSFLVYSTVYDFALHTAANAHPLLRVPSK